MIRILFSISLFTLGLSCMADSAPVYYLKCEIELQSGSSLTRFIELDGYYVKSNSFIKANSYMLTMENKVGDEHFLNLLRENYKDAKIYDFATRIPLTIDGYDHEIGYVKEEDFEKIKVDSIKNIVIKDIIGRRRDLGVYIVSTLEPENNFWNQKPLMIYDVKGCSYLACNFKVFQYEPNERLKKLINLLNSEQNPCNKEPEGNSEVRTMRMAWDEIRAQIIEEENVIVMGIYCND